MSLLRPRLALSLGLCGFAACSPGRVSPNSTTGQTDEAHESSTSFDAEDATESPDTGSNATGNTNGAGDEDGEDDLPRKCSEGGTCPPVDVLVVVDNSGTMARKQAQLAASIPQLAAALKSRIPANAGQPDAVQVMFTSADMSHINCVPLQPDGYDPLRGHPQTENCRERLDHFTGLSSVSPDMLPEVCTDHCPDASVRPRDPHVSFSFDGTQSNVPGHSIEAALSCLAPQGICGCSYESPLESMLQALDPAAAWNDPSATSRPFLRDEAILALVLMTDELDCSLRLPRGEQFFTTDDTYWEVHPDLMRPYPSSAICWNSSVECSDPNDSGGFERCEAVDHDVLHPLSRYESLFSALRSRSPGKEIVMMGLVGVPQARERHPDAPYHAVRGGIHELEFRPWRETDVVAGTDEGVADLAFEFGIGPGCTSFDATGQPQAHAIPPVRIRKLCQGLDGDEGIASKRCCLESICADDFSGAMRCLDGLIELASDRITAASHPDD